MGNKNIRGICGLAVVTLLSFGVILGTRKITGNDGGAGGGQNSGSGQNGYDSGQGSVGEESRELDTDNMEEIESAAVLSDDSFRVVVRTAGYAGDIRMAAAFEEDRQTLREVEILEQTETEDVGSGIAEDKFLAQFAGMKAPLRVPGKEASGGKTEEERGNGTEDEAQQDAGGWEGAELADGTYEARGIPDSNGYVDTVTIIIEGGQIHSASWDAVTEGGESKARLSEAGEYMMTEDGLTWKEQAEAVTAVLVENQSLDFFEVDEQGKTDAVSGVSISVGGFTNLAEQCLRQAAGIERGEGGEESTVESSMDAISGATMSSRAVAEGINLAYDFLQGAEK